MSARLLSLLFPSWKLFDHVEDPFLLEIRLRGESEWRQALTPLRRPWYALVFDPEGNLKRASQSLVERLIQETARVSADQLVRTFEYRSVRALARERGGASVAQFRIRQGDAEPIRSEEFA